MWNSEWVGQYCSVKRWKVMKNAAVCAVTERRFFNIAGIYIKVKCVFSESEYIAWRNNFYSCKGVLQILDAFILSLKITHSHKETCYACENDLAWKRHLKCKLYGIKGKIRRTVEKKLLLFPVRLCYYSF